MNLRPQPVAAVLAALLATAALAACGGANLDARDPSASVEELATLPAGSPLVPSTPAPAGTASPSPGDVTIPTEEDERLLAVLPEAIDGTPVQLERLAFEEARSQPDFAASIASAVFFVVPGPDDLVSGLVARPRDGIHSDAWYRDWRETYDDGACGQAGGVGGRAEAELDGRPVSITTCAGGMRVYHAWVEEQGVVVSLIALGDGRWGEKAMASLRS